MLGQMTQLSWQLCEKIRRPLWNTVCYVQTDLALEVITLINLLLRTTLRLYDKCVKQIHKHILFRSQKIDKYQS